MHCRPWHPARSSGGVDVVVTPIRSHRPSVRGTVRVSQIQLLQPLLSLTWRSLFLDEHLDALIVETSVAGSRRSVIA